MIAASRLAAILAAGWLLIGEDEAVTARPTRMRDGRGEGRAGRSPPPQSQSSQSTFDQAALEVLGSLRLSQLSPEWPAEAAIWHAKANRRLASPTYRPRKSRRASHRRWKALPDPGLVVEENDVGRRYDRVPGQLPNPLGDRRHDQGSIAASVAEHAGRDQAPRGRPRRDGELEVLQPRLPSPAQRAPPAPQPPLNNDTAASPHRRANGQRPSRSIEARLWAIRAMVPAARSTLESAI